MVYVFLADGFEELEALAPVDVLRRAGLEVCMVSVYGGGTVTGSHGVAVKADITLDEADIAQAQALVLPGGPGTELLLKSDALCARLKQGAQRGLLLGAICAAPSVLGQLGLLTGKRATCFPSYEDQLKGACVTSQAVVRDGQMVTARGAGVSLEFAFVLAEALCGADKAQQLRVQMQCADV